MGAQQRVYRNRIGSTTSMRKIFSAWVKYFIPGFHPWNEDDRHLIAAYEASAPKVEAGRKVRRAA